MNLLEEKRIETTHLTIGVLANALLDHTGFWEVSEPKKGKIPHLPQIGNTVLVIEPCYEPLGKIAAKVIVKDSGYHIMRYSEFPNGRTLKDFNPSEYV
jgi:hypothetical protein